MNTANPDIPTLTDIIEPGDESMKNHFDASYFDEHDEAQQEMFPEGIMAEQESPVEQVEELSAVEDEDIDTVETKEDADELETAAAEMAEQYSKDEPDLKTEVSCLIQDALNEALPSIEERLKEDLIEAVMQKLESKDSEQ